MLDINRGLAEFYGDVLPDIDPEQPERAPSTAVAKDLQFYWTPDAVIAKALEFANVHNITEYRQPVEPLRILEPSCGDGRILDAIRKNGHQALGIEYHAGRADQAKAKGHSVVTANFLECPPRAEFDVVVMNPPFYGRHYVKHVRHALKFIKPGGTLVAVLPSTAHYDHQDIEGEWVREVREDYFGEGASNEQFDELLRKHSQIELELSNLEKNEAQLAQAAAALRKSLEAMAPLIRDVKRAIGK